jgi:hypothetical protein
MKKWRPKRSEMFHEGIKYVAANTKALMISRFFVTVGKLFIE